MSEQPTSQTNYDSTRFSDGDGIDLHASQLDRLVASAATPEVRQQTPEQESIQMMGMLSTNLAWARIEAIGKTQKDYDLAR